MLWLGERERAVVRSAFPSPAECKAAAEKMSREFQGARLELKCLPDTLDPRGARAERSKAMSYSISTLLTRNLHDVFGENDGTRRRAAIDEIYTEDCVFYDPTKGVYRGRDEIDGHLREAFDREAPTRRWHPHRPIRHTAEWTAHCHCN